MYVSAFWAQKEAPDSAEPRRPSRVSKTVVFLGLTSLLTDISSEMVVSVLPMFLVTVMGVGPVLFGVVDGLYQGASAVVRLVAGFAADRLRAAKAVATLGYGFSALARIPLLLTPTVGAITAAVTMDRVGKGIRTAPRDAMIAGSSDDSNLGRSFGVHRAMDTAGALMGPLVAFGLLAWFASANSGEGYSAIFAVSLVFAVAGVLTLVLLVRQPATTKSEVKLRLKDALGLLRHRRFRALLIAAASLSLVTVSDAFLYLIIQERHEVPSTLFPLLFTVTAVVYMVAAVPVGRLADRFGRVRVWLVGYIALLAAYVAVLLVAHPVVSVCVALALLGAFYAATDGVLSAAAAPYLPAELRSSGMALLQTGVALGRLLASILFGLVWAWLGAGTALAVFTVLLAVVLLSVNVRLRRYFDVRIAL